MKFMMLACPVCFQVDDAHAAAGVRAGVIVLIVVTALVLGGLGVFMRRLMSKQP
jgi:hypothetical protein